MMNEVTAQKNRNKSEKPIVGEGEKNHRHMGEGGGEKTQ